jgi:predicted transcriptional regulator
MPITKKQIIEAIEAMPKEEFDSADEVIEEIILLEKIEKGLEAVRKGEVLSEEEIDKEIEKW